MIGRPFVATSSVLIALFAARSGLAEDRADAPPSSAASRVERASRAGAFLPLTLFPNVGDASAIAAGYAGYDSARDSARLQSFAEARLFGPLALRVGVQSQSVSERVSPSAMARVQLLSQAKQGIDGAVALAYKAEGFNEPEGELELVMAFGGTAGGFRFLGNFAYGQDPEGAERDGELRAAVLRSLATRYTLGLDARGRFDLGSEQSKLLAKNEPRFDLDAGPVFLVALGPLEIGLHAGLAAFDRVSAPSQLGCFAMAGLGTAL
jgi:hypothetical protein